MAHMCKSENPCAYHMKPGINLRLSGLARPLLVQPSWKQGKREECKLSCTEIYKFPNGNGNGRQNKGTRQNEPTKQTTKTEIITKLPHFLIITQSNNTKYLSKKAKWGCPLQLTLSWSCGWYLMGVVSQIASRKSSRKIPDLLALTIFLTIFLQCFLSPRCGGSLWMYPLALGSTTLCLIGCGFLKQSHLLQREGSLMRD